MTQELATISTLSNETSLKPRIRDFRLDAARGLMLVLMTFNHTPTLLSGWTLQYFGYISEFEGFVFLSGLVAGLTCTRVAVERGNPALWHRSLLRARTIYLYHMAGYIILLPLIRAFADGRDYWRTWFILFDRNVLKTVFMCGSLLYQPKFMDILPMYVVFVLATPLVIQELIKGKGIRILALSTTIWFLAQFGLQDRFVGCLATWLPVYLGSYSIFAWQLLFASGLFCGYLYFKGMPQGALVVKRILVTSAGVVLLVLFFVRHGLIHLKDVNAFLEAGSSKAQFGYTRLLDTASLFFLLVCGSNFFTLNLPIKCLALLGRHSLQVFFFHLPIITCMNLFLIDKTFVSKEMVKTLLAILAVISLYLPAGLFEYLQNRRLRFSNRTLRGVASP
jgi:hypothetical protein